MAGKPQAYCPRLEGLVPWFLINRRCLDTFELLNISADHPLSLFFQFFNDVMTQSPAREERAQQHEQRRAHEERRDRALEKIPMWPLDMIIDRRMAVSNSGPITNPSTIGVGS